MSVLGTSAGRTNTPGVFTCTFTMTCDGTGVFKTSDIAGDNKFVKSILTEDLPDGVFIVELSQRVKRFAFVDISLHMSEDYLPPYPDAGYAVGALAPLGFNESNTGACASFGYRENGALVAGPANATVTIEIIGQQYGTGER